MLDHEKPEALSPQAVETFRETAYSPVSLDVDIEYARSSLDEPTNVEEKRETRGDNVW